MLLELIGQSQFHVSKIKNGSPLTNIVYIWQDNRCSSQRPLEFDVNGLLVCRGDNQGIVRSVYFLLLEAGIMDTLDLQIRDFKQIVTW